MGHHVDDVNREAVDDIDEKDEAEHGKLPSVLQLHSVVMKASGGRSG